MRNVLTVMAVCAGWCSERPGMCCAQGVVIIGVAYMYCTPPCDVTAPPQRMSPNCRGGRGISLDRQRKGFHKPKHVRRAGLPRRIPLPPPGHPRRSPSLSLKGHTSLPPRPPQRRTRPLHRHHSLQTQCRPSARIAVQDIQPLRL